MREAKSARACRRSRQVLVVTAGAELSRGAGEVSQIRVGAETGRRAWCLIREARARLSVREDLVESQ